MSVLDDVKLGELWYEYKFYRTFLREITDMFKELFTDSVRNNEEQFVKKIKGDQILIQRVFKQMSDKYLAAIEDHTPALHDTVKRHLGIKRNILHPDDSIYSDCTSEEEENLLRDKLDSLKKRYLALVEVNKQCADLKKKIDNISSPVGE